MGFYDSQKSRKGDITYFCEKTGWIFREDIEVCKMYIHKDLCAEPEKIISRSTFKLIERKDTVLQIIPTYDV